MRITVTSAYGCPCVLPQGETNGRKIVEYAVKKGAFVQKGGVFRYCVEFSALVGPELWSGYDLQMQTWMEHEKGRSD